MRSGTWLNAATAGYPAVVLGADRRRPARHRRGRAGHAGLARRPVVHRGRHPRRRCRSAPELDTAALVGWPGAEDELGFDGHPTTIYTRSATSAVEAVQAVLGRDRQPGGPERGRGVPARPTRSPPSRPPTQAFTGLLLGLGAVALLVGGVGVANTMVISVLERRPEIGLRRSLGATRGQIRIQFLAESLLLSALGGHGGVLLGIASPAGTRRPRAGRRLSRPGRASAACGATLVIGALAGLYPAVRAARLAPTEALATP